MDSTTHEPQPPAPFPTVTIRHDGWTGEKIATFCETLADSGVVAEACEAAGMSAQAAYAARRRNPVFAAAWDAALTVAREKLADTLLARSIEGNVELIYRDGELVGERHVIDNKLGLAILRRLGRLAETGLSVSLRGERGAKAPAPKRGPVNWELALDALRTGDEQAVLEAMAMIKSNEVDEVDGPPNSLIEDESLDLSDRCWWDEREKVWMTDFPPPAGFDGYESRRYDEIADEESYARACTSEEAAILEADRATDLAADRADDEDLRDRWFALLRSECAAP